MGMLIEFQKIVDYLSSIGKVPRGVLHIGAHTCEEKEDYNKHGITDENIIWVEGNEDLVKQMKGSGIVNLHHALIADEERDVTFYITNNGQSSSILEMGTHKDLYKWCVVVEERKQKTITIKKLVETNNINMTNLNMWVFDIQGAELLALKGAGDLIKYADALYLEVNTDEVYKNCAKLNELDEFLYTHGFDRVAVAMFNSDGWGDAFWVRTRTIIKSFDF
jgi:FkbM family methyltransferase